MNDAIQLPPARDRYLGETLAGRYRVLRKIGKGGMGAVYEAEHCLVGHRVAVKLLHAQMADNAEIVQRFLREAKAAAMIGHPNIVQVTDMGALDDGSPFMVLELLAGRDLAKDIEAPAPFDAGRLCHVLYQSCDALHAAHELGIVHRDLKPENLFLIPFQGDDDFVKVLDFGISKMKVEGEGHGLTKTGMALGTPYYMSPEQCRGEPDVDRRADIYALGVIAYQALTGRVPYDHHSYPMLVLRIMEDPIPRVRSVRPDVPEGLDALVAQMMAKDRTQRPASCAEIQARLIDLLPAVRAAGGAAPVYRPRGTSSSSSSMIPTQVLAPAEEHATSAVRTVGAGSHRVHLSPARPMAAPATQAPSSEAGARSAGPRSPGPRSPGPSRGALVALVALGMGFVLVLGAVAGAVFAFSEPAPSREASVAVGEGAGVEPMSAGNDSSSPSPARTDAPTEGSERATVTASAADGAPTAPVAGSVAGDEDRQGPGAPRGPGVEGDREGAAPDGRGGAASAAGGAEGDAAEPGAGSTATPAAEETGHLTVTAIPFGTILLDGRVIGRNRARIAVSPGRHTITVRNPGGASQTRRVTIDPGGRERVAIRL